jgi:hypothetical protein
MQDARVTCDMEDKSNVFYWTAEDGKVLKRTFTLRALHRWHPVRDFL